MSDDPTADRSDKLGEEFLAERVKQLALRTDPSSLDMAAFYTPEQIADMLQCDVRTLERRRDVRAPPLWMAVGRCIRHPAILFWAWVVSQLRGRASSLLRGDNEPPERSQ